MSRMVFFLVLAMAIVAALTYVLLGAGVLTAGSLGADAMPSFYYIIPAAYVIMGIFVLSRWRWIKILSAVVVVFTIGVFYTKYASQPDVMWSAPGLITKIAQIIMLAGLIYLIANPAPKTTK
jgi:hypothetical protein